MSRATDTIVAVDTGGTFTDFVVLRRGVLEVHKRASTPDDPARAVLAGLRELIRDGESFVLAHGSTVATNALLERRGARIAWITNAGFEDLIEIARQNRPQLYALVGHRPPPLVAREDRIGIKGRLLKDGSEETALDEAELSELAGRIGGAESAAIGLLHSYANPAHETSVAEALADLEVSVTCSALLLPEYREYERFSTALVNAYVAPLVQRYLTSLVAESAAKKVRIMGSNGGALSVERASREPVHTILSGPAGGVVAALEAGRRVGVERVLAFDMGGTSTDVSLCPGHALNTREYSIAGAAVAVPVIDIHTVGAGGGSIARLDPGGALKVGPESAGAEPGPICYGRGGKEVTVTDAHVWLGRIPADRFLGGTMRLQRDAITAPLMRLAETMGATMEDAADGVLAVADSTMESALRLISVERGFDPESLVLVAFGGAAPLHAAQLAGRLGVRRVLVPPDPGTLSARGILIADVRKDASRSVLRKAEAAGIEALETEFVELEGTAIAEVVGEGFSAGDVRVERSIDARYSGQSYELGVPASAEWIDAFHAAHQRRFGFSRADEPVEAVTLRVQASAAVERPKDPRLPKSSSSPEPEGGAAVYVEGAWIDVRLYRRETFEAGARIVGPAVIIELTSTCWIPPGWALAVADTGDLLLSPETA